MRIEKVQKNLSKNMIWYTLLTIGLGTILGYYFNLKFFSKYILYVVFVMIYPMMVNISVNHLRKIRGSVKPLITALFLNFVYAPLLIYALSSIFINDPWIKLGLILLSIAPASSMGLGYLGLAEGHMLSGAIIVAFAFIVSVFIYPIAGSYLVGLANLSVPTSLILKKYSFDLSSPFNLRYRYSRVY